MADLSLYLTNFNISLGQTMENDKISRSEQMEIVEIGDSADGRGKLKVPRRTIYFASGETMEEYSTDEEEEEEDSNKEISTVDPSTLTWGPYFWFHMWRMATSTISVCDYMGEKLASIFGITSPKYQYAIDEYYRMKKEEEEEEEENRLAEEAERSYEEQRRVKQEELSSAHPATIEQPDASRTSFVNISFELDPEPLSDTEAKRVPSPLPT
ncbi:protein FAM177A1 [Synchiropus picturatus]